MLAENTYSPKVLNDLVLLSVAPVIGVLLPILDVDVRDTAYEQLQLTLVEDVDQVGWNQLVEAGDEGVELLFDTFLDTPFRD